MIKNILQIVLMLCLLSSQAFGGAQAPPDASQVYNDSTVSGSSVKDALQTLDTGKLPLNYSNEITTTPYTANIVPPQTMYRVNVGSAAYVNLDTAANLSGYALVFIIPGAYAITFDAGTSGTILHGATTSQTFVSAGNAGDYYAFTNTGTKTWIMTGLYLQDRPGKAAALNMGAGIVKTDSNGAVSAATFAEIVAVELAAVPRKVYWVYGSSPDGGTTPDSATQASIDALIAAGVPEGNVRWLYIASGFTMGINNAVSASSADNIVLVQHSGVFTIADISSGSSAENVTLIFAGSSFAPSDMASASSAENVTLVFSGGTLTIEDMASTSSTENVVITNADILVFAIEDMSAVTYIENIDLVFKGGIFIAADATSASSMENVTLTGGDPAGGTFTVENIASASTSENVVIILHGAFALEDAASGSSADNVVLTISSGTAYYFGSRTNKTDVPTGGSFGNVASGEWRKWTTGFTSSAAGAITELCIYSRGDDAYCADGNCTDEETCSSECESTWHPGGDYTMQRLAVYNTSDNIVCQMTSFMSPAAAEGWHCSSALTGTCTVAGSTVYRPAHAGSEGSSFYTVVTGTGRLGNNDYWSNPFPSTLSSSAGNSYPNRPEFVIKVQP